MKDIDPIVYNPKRTDENDRSVEENENLNGFSTLLSSQENSLSSPKKIISATTGLESSSQEPTLPAHVGSSADFFQQEAESFKNSDPPSANEVPPTKPLHLFSYQITLNCFILQQQ